MNRSYRCAVILFRFDQFIAWILYIFEMTFSCLILYPNFAFGRESTNYCCNTLILCWSCILNLSPWPNECFLYSINVLDSSFWHILRLDWRSTRTLNAYDVYFLENVSASYFIKASKTKRSRSLSVFLFKPIHRHIQHRHSHIHIHIHTNHVRRKVRKDG